jgi:hypothetical protein
MPSLGNITQFTVSATTFGYRVCKMSTNVGEFYHQRMKNIQALADEANKNVILSSN